MKRIRACGVAVCGLVLMAVAAAGAQEKSAAQNIRVLLVIGGHDFEQAAFFKMFDARKDLTCRKATYPQAAELLKPGLEQECDVIVMYDMVKTITPEQRQAFLALLKTGMGLVLLHHNLGAHVDWPEFAKIRGGTFLWEPGVMDGKTYPKSTYADDQQIQVTVADRRHPITKGLADYQIQDEVYGDCYVSPKVHVLLKTNHPKSCPELAWVNQYGKSRVFYFMSGHGASAWNNPNFTEILFRGIRWAAGRK